MFNWARKEASELKRNSDTTTREWKGRWDQMEEDESPSNDRWKVILLPVPSLPKHSRCFGIPQLLMEQSRTASYSVPSIVGEYNIVGIMARKQLKEAEWASTCRTYKEKLLLLHSASSNIPRQSRVKQGVSTSLVKGTVLPGMDCSMVWVSHGFSPL